MAREMVMMDARASGMAATASATAKSSASVSIIPLYMLRAKTTAQMIIMATDSFLLKLSMVTWRGVFLSEVSFIRSAILPSSVPRPTLVMTARPLPYVTSEPEKIMLSWSPRATFSSGMISMLFSALSDSPVSALSLVFIEWFSNSRPSPGMTSPASSITMSPHTSSAASMTRCWPSLMTLASGEDSFLRLSRDFSAFMVCMVPRMALSMSTAMITTVLSRLPVTVEMRAAMMSIITSRSLNCPAKIARTLFFFFS